MWVSTKSLTSILLHKIIEISRCIKTTWSLICGWNQELHNLVGKTKILMLLTLLLSQKSYFVTKREYQGFQPLLGPYLRVIDMKPQWICSRWCITLLCQVARKKKVCLMKYICDKHWQPLFGLLGLLGHLRVKSAIFHVNKICIYSSQGSHYVSRLELLPPHTKGNNTTFTSRATF